MKNTAIINPESPDPHWVLSDYYWQTGMIEEALGEANSLVERLPNSAEAYTHRAHLLSEAGDADGAIESFRTAVSLNPHRTEPRVSLAENLFEAGYYEDALFELDTAMAMLPEGSQLITRLDEMRRLMEDEWEERIRNRNE